MAVWNSLPDSLVFSFQRTVSEQRTIFTRVFHHNLSIYVFLLMLDSHDCEDCTDFGKQTYDRWLYNDAYIVFRRFVIDGRTDTSFIS